MSPKSDTFSAAEKAAMRERAKERKAQARAAQQRDVGEADVQAKISEMSDPDRTLATQIHALISQHAPTLWPRTWYGMPAYTLDGKVVCFFQSGQKFATRYCTLGFQERAMLDDGDMWPTAYAVTAITPAVEAQIIALLRRALQ
jgi:uncharacterized protein YdhG (YjbR/CyaY superfamily)